MSNDAYPNMELPLDQAKVIVTLERTGASLSLIGVALIVVTFALFKRLRTIPNTFILFASVANIGASIASLIGLNGLHAGFGSSLCRAQAFLLEMCMQSDPWWSFAMAFNVYLVFFHAANPTTFRRYLWLYALICFGIPMIPAIVCLYVENSNKGPVYADATLWCWIGDRWNSVRIYSYYIPIWVCIFMSAVIYIAVGYHVFHQRNQLRNITLSAQGKDISTGGTDTQISTDKNMYYGTVTTEVYVTTDVCDPVVSHNPTPPPPMTPLHPQDCPWDDEPFPTEITNTSVQEAQDRQHEQQDANPPRRLHSLLRHSRNNNSNNNNSDEESVLPAEPPAIYGSSSSPTAAPYRSTSTTVTAAPRPSSARSNLTRIGGGSHRGSRRSRRRSYEEFTRTSPAQARQNSVPTVIASNPAAYAEPSGLARLGRVGHRFANKFRRMDPVKLAYLRTSFVFAISVLVTWTPASVNRVCAIVNPASVNFAMNIASAAVLPLQGVWNAVIYFTTSWSLLKEELDSVVYRSHWLRRLSGGMDGSGLVDRGRLPGPQSAVGSLRVVADSPLHGGIGLSHVPSAGRRHQMQARSPMTYIRRPRPDPHVLHDDDLLFDDDDDDLNNYSHTARSKSTRSSSTGPHGRWAPPVVSPLLDIAAPRNTRRAGGTLRVQRGSHFDI